MNHGMKKWLIRVGVLMVLGAVLFAAVMTAYDWDFSRLSTVEYETNAHEVTDAFSHISVITDEADIRFLPAEDGKCKVVCYEDVNAVHAVSVAEDTLTIAMEDGRDWRKYLAVDFNVPKITVFLPGEAYCRLTVTSDTGDIEIPGNFAFDTVLIEGRTGDVNYCAPAAEGITIRTATGDIRAENVTAGAMMLSVSTGDIVLSRVTAREMLSAEIGTGDIRLDKCDAGEIIVRTGTGDVTGTLLSGKIFSAKSGTGRVEVPESAAGGKCTIHTGTGDIAIRLAPDEQPGR